MKLGVLASAIVLAMGLVLSFIPTAGPTGNRVLLAGLAMLVSLPVLNVVRVLVEELRRRAWVFAAVTAGVLVVVGYAIARLL